MLSTSTDEALVHLYHLFCSSAAEAEHHRREAVHRSAEQDRFRAGEAGRGRGSGEDPRDTGERSDAIRLSQERRTRENEHAR